MVIMESRMGFDYEIVYSLMRSGGSGCAHIMVKNRPANSATAVRCTVHMTAQLKANAAKQTAHPSTTQNGPCRFGKRPKAGKMGGGWGVIGRMLLVG